MRNTAHPALKKQMSNLADPTKKTITPRGGGLTFNKLEKTGSAMNNSRLDQSLNNNLSKSINNFNSSLKS